MDGISPPRVGHYRMAFVVSSSRRRSRRVGSPFSARSGLEAEVGLAGRDRPGVTGERAARGLNLRLDALAAEVDQLPLLPGRVSGEAKPAPRQTLPDSFWLRLREEAWQDFKQLVRIQNLEKPELPLLPPGQAYFLRENLRLRLLSARLALLQRNEASYKADIKAADEWMKRYFDTSDQAVRSALGHLKHLGQSRLSIDLPDISASLNAARTFKLAREKAGN